MDSRSRAVKFSFTAFAFFINFLNTCSSFGLNSLIGHECGEVKQRASGMIQSPRLPASYSRAVLCRWKIIAPENYNEIYIYLWLNGGKKLTYDLTHCFSDHLAINQIINGRREKRVKYCGKNGFFRTRTFGREAEVRFWVSPSRRDNKDGRTRFRLLWFASKGCSSLIHGQQGIIQSPNYPNNYPSDTFCTWRLSTPFKDGIIKMRFVKFDLQGNSPRCRKDYLIIKDGKKTIGMFCGKKSVGELNIEGDTAVIIFKSNKKRNFPGFKIEWSSEYLRKKDMSCGHSNFPPQPYNHRQRRFVGGRIAQKGNIPWLAQIISTQQTDDSSHVREVRCGGALIGDKWILTAAHCLLPLKKLRYRVYLGGQESRDITARTVNVKNIHIHPRYMGMLSDDVALLELEEKQEQSFAVRKICLPDSDTAKSLLNSETKCWMAGWGKKQDGHLSNNLFYSELKYTGHCLFRPDVVCARSPDAERKVGPCDGDSGGPLFCQVNGGRFFVTGILTHGPKVCGTKEDFYADVAHYNTWIDKIMKANEVIDNNTKDIHHN